MHSSTRIHGYAPHSRHRSASCAPYRGVLIADTEDGIHDTTGAWKHACRAFNTRECVCVAGNMFWYVMLTSGWLVGRAHSFKGQCSEASRPRQSYNMLLSSLVVAIAADLLCATSCPLYSYLMYHQRFGIFYEEEPRRTTCIPCIHIGRSMCDVGLPTGIIPSFLLQLLSYSQLYE
ncbi:hypothetical protein C8Q73DRAFT_494317 [Cubamyces lactineus]|nr:hypothetical protein C8Q73DRAFT_494317 [Cubamyces lactineus]